MSSSSKLEEGALVHFFFCYCCYKRASKTGNLGKGVYLVSNFQEASSPHLDSGLWQGLCAVKSNNGKNEWAEDASRRDKAQELVSLYNNSLSLNSFSPPGDENLLSAIDLALFP